MNSSTQKGEMPFSRSCIHAGGNGHVVPYSESQPSKSNSASPPCPSPTLEDHRPHKKVVRYKECLKNHAATIGGNVTDGCGEFMPSTGDEGTIEALKCSACNCHRNFHRKEIESHCPSQCYHTPLILNNAILGSPIGYPANSLIVSYKSGSVPSESDEKDDDDDDDDDGCGVVATGDEGTIEALKCSACNCHRNFHRKEIESHCPSQCYHTPLILNNAILGSPIGYPANSLIVSYKSGSVPSESDEKDDDDDDGCGVVARPAEKVRKRFRTKFTKEQKEKMLSFAEKAGWKMQKLEESTVQQFCQETGIKRRVLKAWMHNNKHKFVLKKETPPAS